MAAEYPGHTSIARTRHSRRRLLGATALGTGGMAALLAACGGKSSQSKAPTAAGQANAAKSGGQLNMVLHHDPDSLDLSTKVNGAVVSATFTNDSLLSFKAGSDVKYTDLILQSGLAERWEVPDAQTYTFHLRPGIQFANLPPLNGRAFTSQDVKWSYEYLSRTGDLKSLRPAPISSLFEGLSAIDTPDATTATIRFSQPFAPFLTTAALAWSSVLAHDIFDADGDFSKRVVGTGPWQLDMSQTQPGQRWVYKKNPTYFLPGIPYIDQVNQLVLADDSTITAAFQTKQLDLMSYDGLALSTVEQLKRAVPSAVVYDDSQPSPTTYLHLNQSKPPFNDVRIRMALSLSINRDEFVKVVGEGHGDWALAGGTPGLFSSEEIRQILKYDVASAKKLLSDAGYPNGVDIECIYPGNKYGLAYVNGLQLLQAQAKQAGINITLKSLDNATEKNRRVAGDFQLGNSPSPTGSAADADGVLSLYYLPDSASNYGRVNDPQLTTLINAQRREADPAKRKQLIRQAVQRINDVPQGLAFIYGRVYEVSYPYFKNYAPNLGSVGPGSLMRESWLDK